MFAGFDPKVIHEYHRDGELIQALVPGWVLKQWRELRQQAQRGQTAKIEASVPIKSPLGNAVPSGNAEPAPEPIKSMTVREQKRAEAEALFYPEPLKSAAVEPEPVAVIDAPPMLAIPPAVERPPLGKSGHYFFREFMAKPPKEVQTRIDKGIPCYRAWREYRGYTIPEAAELYGCHATMISMLENGKSKPLQPTLEKLATIYDAHIFQLTPKPGSDDSPHPVHLASLRNSPAPTVKTAAPAPVVEPPASTTWPPEVLKLMREGKTPFTAWRTYRNKSIAQIAKEYGSDVGNISRLDDRQKLWAATRDKLATIFKCTPEQLIRPADLDKLDPPKKKVKGPPPEPEPTSTMAAAFAQAQKTKEEMKWEGRARMQGH